MLFIIPFVRRSVLISRCFLLDRSTYPCSPCTADMAMAIDSQDSQSPTIWISANPTLSKFVMLFTHISHDSMIRVYLWSSFTPIISLTVSPQWLHRVVTTLSLRLSKPKRTQWKRLLWPMTQRWHPASPQKPPS